VEGKRWRLIWGERMSAGSGDCRSVGSRSCRVRTVLPNLSVRSSGGWWSPRGSGEGLAGVCENHSSRLMLSMSLTWAKHRQSPIQVRGSHPEVRCLPPAVRAVPAGAARATIAAWWRARTKRRGVREEALISRSVIVICRQAPTAPSGGRLSSQALYDRRRARRRCLFVGTITASSKPRE